MQRRKYSREFKLGSPVRPRRARRATRISAPGSKRAMSRATAPMGRGASGTTVEAGLVTRELLLRRRIDFILIAAPPTMTIQWKDELETKFGLSFEIIDRERIGELRRLRGFSVNPWATGSRFIISHRLLTDEVYAAGLRDMLGEFRPRALFILDEAHHAAPSAGTLYRIEKGNGDRLIVRDKEGRRTGTVDPR